MNSFHRSTIVATAVGAFLWGSEAVADLSIQGSVSPSNLPYYLNDHGANNLDTVSLYSGASVTLDGGDSIQHEDLLTLYGIGTTLGTLTLSGSGTTWGCSDLDLRTSQIDILDGADLYTSSPYDGISAGIDKIGNQSGNRAFIRISGEGSLYQTQNNIYLPYASPGATPQPVGEIMIEDGGQMIWANLGSHADKFWIGSARAGAAGTLTVTGVGSNLTLAKGFDCTVKETGKLVIANGASLTETFPFDEGSSDISVDGVVEILSAARVEVGSFGVRSGGELRISGAGSQLNLNSGLGNSGHFSAGNGSKVTCLEKFINYGTMEFLVSGSDLMHVGADPSNYNQFDNRSGAVVTFKANPGLAAGSYNPVTSSSPTAYPSFIGSGTYKAIGGTWDTATETFTVPASEIMTIGVTNQYVNARRFVWQRPSWRSWSSSFSSAAPSFRSFTSLSSPPSEDALNVAFSSDAGTASFSSSEVTTLSPINGLQMLVAYDIISDLSGSETAVAFDVGSAFSSDNLSVFQSSDGGNSWTEIDSFSYADGWISFSTTTFGRFAITIDSPIGNAWTASVEIIDGSDVELSVPTQTEKLYSIWSSDSLLKGSWACMSQLTGDGTSRKVSDPSGLKSAQFYLVREN